MTKFFTILFIFLFMDSYVMAMANKYEALLLAGEEQIQNKQYSDAVDTYSQILEIFKHGEADDAVARGLEYGGNACILIGNYVKAIEFYKVAIDESERLGNHQVFEACSNNIGYMYAIFKDYPHAVSHFRKALSSALEHGDEDMVGNAATNLVTTYSLMKEPKLASNYLALFKRHPLPDKNLFQYQLLNNEADILRATGHYDEAIVRLKQSLPYINERKGMDLQVATTYYYIGANFKDLRRSDSAVVYLNRSQAVCNRSKMFPYLLYDIYKDMENAYSQAGQEDSMRLYRSKYEKVADDILSDTQFGETSKSRVHYEANKMDNRIFSLDSTIRAQLGIIVLFVLLFSVVVVLSIVLYRKNRKLEFAYDMLISKSRELDTYNEDSMRLRHEYLAMQQDAKNTAFEMSEKQRLNLIEEIEKVLDDKEKISDPEFNLAILARLVNSNTKYVSQVINTTYHKNFRTLLTEYRIREACRMLTDTKNFGMLTISAVAEEVGYKAQSSFVLAFRKVIGMTPSEYKKHAGG